MAATMEAKIKACTSPHALAHSLAGAGVGLILAALVPSLATVTIGIIVLVVAIGIDFAVNKG